MSWAVQDGAAGEVILVAPVSPEALKTPVERRCAMLWNSSRTEYEGMERRGRLLQGCYWSQPHVALDYPADCNDYGPQTTSGTPQS